MLTELLARTFERIGTTAERVVAVPAVIEGKLLRLVETADAARAALVTINAQLGEARAEQQAVQGELTKWTAYKARNPHDHSRVSGEDRAARQAKAYGEPFTLERSTREDVIDDVAGLEARLAVATRTLERIAPRQRDAQARSDAAGRLAQRATEWTKVREPAALVEAVAQSARAVASFRLPRDPTRLPVELGKVRAELRALMAERETVARVPVTLAEARDRAMAIVDGIVAGSTFDDVGGFFSPDYDPGSPYAGGAIVPHALDAAGVRAFFVSLLVDKLKASVVTLLEREAKGHKLSLTDADRTQRLEALDTKAVLLGLKEEALIMATEADGRQADRREDADCACVLTAPVLEAA